MKIKYLKYFIIIFSLSYTPARQVLKNEKKIIVDSELTLEQALSGKDIPEKVKNNLAIIDVEYFSFDGKYHRGQLVVNKDITEEVKGIFETLKKIKFPIEKVIPICKYNWSDIESMKDNNTSAFNYRTVAGSKKLSTHAMGKAIDINPMLNPQMKNGMTIPPKAEYIEEKAGTISANSLVVKAFRKRGWMWGGYWRSTKDYQHFEKK